MLTKKKYSFCQEEKVKPRIDIGSVKKRYRFCQEKIERVGKRLVVNWVSSRFRLRSLGQNWPKKKLKGQQAKTLTMVEC
jgi:hypothetical protein